MPFQGFTMPPPSLGLDLVSPIDNMEPAAALELVNVFPGATAPTVRLGYQEFANLASASGGTASQINFMHEFPLPDGTAQLIAAQTTQLFSVSSTGTITNISKVGGYTSGNWNKEGFRNRLYLANNSGADVPQVYTGTGLATDISVASGGPSGGLTQLSNVSSYRLRLYFIERNSMLMWYDETENDTISTGTSVLKSYDFSGIMRRGGYLLFTGSYTNIRGVSTQDLFMAVSSEGEVVLYSGYSPDDTAWELVAHFIIGKPLGPRAFVRINQDIWIITQQGIVPVSALFELDPQQAVTTVSRTINPLITETAGSLSFSTLWNGFFWPSGRRVYVTLPSSTGTAKFLVYSIDSKAWTTFQLYADQHSVASGKFLDLPFYGSTTGMIYKGETGYADAKPSSGDGQSIAFSGRTAFSFYGSRSNFKQFADIRPILRGKRGLTLNIGIDTDFKRQPTVTSVSTTAGVYTPWGSPWGSAWSSELEYIFDRYAAKGQGHCGAVRFGGAIRGSSLQFFGFEIRYDLGGQV